MIINWALPGLAGSDLIQRIRSTDFPGYVYIILSIAADEKDRVADGLEAGADDYLTTPFTSSELQARLAIGKRILDLEARLREAHDQLQVLVTHDHLTGLLNQRAIYEHAEAELSRAGRESKPVSLILLDVDEFKAVNNRHGRRVGDHVLRLLAEIIVKNKRPYDWAGRWGGDEFLIVLPATKLSEAGAAAERIRLSIAAAPIRLSDPSSNGNYLELRVSLGVTSTLPNGLPTLDMLLTRASKSLQRAKREGRNRVCLFTNE
jgi:two-component system chemotaxis response regulator CheY